MARQPGSLRIVAGTLGGRRIAAPQDPGRRPSTERVREAVFSMLGDAGGRVLDLYCGSGAYGIEALSRGAEEAVLVDLEPEPAASNLERLGLAGRARVERSDALEWLSAEPAAEPGFTLVFCDPPYRLAASIGAELDQALPRHLRPGARVICESSPGAPVALEALELVRERAYGSSLVRIYRSDA